MRLYLDKVFFVDVMYKKNMSLEPYTKSPYQPPAVTSEPKLTKSDKKQLKRDKEADQLLEMCDKKILYKGPECKLENGEVIKDIDGAYAKLNQKAGKRRRRRTTRRRKSSKASKKSRRRRRSHKRRR
jgi:hypothetical protein